MFPLHNPLLIHGDAWGLSLGQGNYTNRLNFDCKWQSRIVCYAFSHYLVQSTEGKKCQRMALLLLLWVTFHTFSVPQENRLYSSNICPCCHAACHQCFCPGFGFYCFVVLSPYALNFLVLNPKILALWKLCEKQPIIIHTVQHKHKELYN